MDNLSSKTDVELKELLDRQVNLLLKKAFVSKLKDGGLKIQNHKCLLEEELNRRIKEKDNASVSSITSNFAESLEWRDTCDVSNDESLVDDDTFDETNPLKIIATQCGTVAYEKLLRKEKPEESLIKPEDLKDYLPSNIPKEEVHSKLLCHKDETVQRSKKIPFKPHSSVKTPTTHSHGYNNPKGPHWEITAATPPYYAHGDIKPISLAESLTLQREHSKKCKDAQVQQQADRLAAQIERLYLSERRGSNASTATSTDEAVQESEHGDDEEQDERGVVIYSLVD